MGALLYREDMDDVRQRMRIWWHEGDFGRPVLQIAAPREEPLENIEVMPEPEGWVTHYSTLSFEYRVNLSARKCVNTHYMGEAVPCVAPNLAPNCLALYLGCHGVEMPDTVWCEPCIESPETARFEVDPENFYWQFTQRLAKEQLRLARGKFLVYFPDFIEGLDTLAAMRGTEELLCDLIERPEWVHSCMRQITDRYFYYYDILYDWFRDETGGSVFWLWGPGRTVKLQCDFSAMISAGMFAEFMGPVLTEMSSRISYALYHLDGPCALQHLDCLLSIPELQVIQWVPGAGVEQGWEKRWWPVYRRILEAGKRIFFDGTDSIEAMQAMKREFGADLNRFAMNIDARSKEHAEKLIGLF